MTDPKGSKDNGNDASRLDKPLPGSASEIYKHLLEGTFYEDYDEATRMTGEMRVIAAFVESSLTEVSGE